MPELRAQLEQIFTPDEESEFTRYFCFGACTAAPNIVVMPDRLWYSFVIPAYVETVAAAIQQGKDVPGLANHVRPEIREAVFRHLDKLSSS